MMIKKHFLVCVSLLLLLLPLQVKKVYGNFIVSDNVNTNSNEISVVIELNEMVNVDEFISFTDDLEYNQELIMKIRAQNKKNYKEKNDLFSKEYIKTNGKVNISEHSPFIFVTFDDYESYLIEKDSFQNLSENKSVDKVYVEETPIFEIASSVSETCVNTSASSTEVDMDKAKSLININSSTTYSGNGVNVGIIDAGYPDDTTNFSKNEIVDYNTTTTSSHTTKVASIIGGTYGIATNADLYIHTYTPYTDSYDFDDAIEWLLDYGVNVVNISMYTDSLTGNQGKYDGYSAYMDHVVWNNYLTIVKSAGNRGADDDYVTNPGVGTNTLSVGSIDGDKNISYFSSWKVNSSVDDVLMKPSLVAPGEYISIPNTNNSSYNSMSGTSFAAPMVTGTIALLMEEFPRLMQYPEAYMSALISGASKLPSQLSVWDTYAGAGLIDYEATREILNSSSYVNASVTNSTSKSTAVISKDVSIGANKEIDYCLFLVQNSNVTSPSSTVYTPNISKYQVIVYDENNEIVETTEYGENSNLIIGTMTNSSTTTKTYTLKVYLVNKTTSNTEYLSLSIYNHTHSYDHSYLWVSYTNHYGYCHCDEFQLQGHAVASGSYNAGQRFATCLLCGGSAEMGFVQLTINSSAVTKVTINGSFILPNGVIVLEDEDLEAYLNGTLVFYDKDKVPEIQ